MYVATDGTFIHQLIPMAKVHFDELPKELLQAVPVYYLYYEGKVHVWPQPSTGIWVCELKPVEVSK